LELNRCETLDEAMRQLTGTETCHSVALAQQETVSLAQVLQVIEQFVLAVTFGRSRATPAGIFGKGGQNDCNLLFCLTTEKGFGTFKMFLKISGEGNCPVSPPWLRAWFAPCHKF